MARSARRLAVLGLLGVLAGCGGSTVDDRSAPAHPSPAVTSRPPARPGSTGGTATAEADRRFVAHATGPVITWYPAPDQEGVGGQLTNPNPQGAPLVFAVRQRRADGWLRVMLPVRPNGTQGWVRAADVRLSTTPYALAVDRTAHSLTIIRDGRQIARLPVGIGTGNTPTPSGTFYLTELLQPGDPNGPWGPYAFGLSGFSDVITNFNGADGIIGLHGTNRPDLVGTDASMGCIRLRNTDIERLASLIPVGTPISIRG
ncbi:L,D-transpeptidase [Frankia sp. R82]|uniref:L,D-transpeptidase n=1 Tax=Frankia sp. R82 TaxID=2950553 RepID=UPI0020445279|nr:L,D-transpeptidase [Frankia sp. R82]MCM3883797.1 L,D-transpeptidase [Frankia sp. R82]